MFQLLLLDHARAGLELGGPVAGGADLVRCGGGRPEKERHYDSFWEETGFGTPTPVSKPKILITLKLKVSPN